MTAAEAAAAVLFHPWGWGFPARDLPLVALAAALAVPRLRRRRRLVAALAAVSVLALGARIAVREALIAEPPPPGPGLRVVVANIWRDNPRLAEDLARLFATGPDVLALLEATPALDAALDAAAPPDMRVLRPTQRWMQRRLAVRTATVETTGRDGAPPLPPLQSFEVARPCAPPLTLLVVHLGSPFDPRRPGKAAALVEARAAARPPPGALLLAGDFNATADHPDLALIAEGLGLDPLGAPTPTFLPGVLPAPRVLLPLLGLRIDHALAGPGLAGARAATLALPGSDHDALVVDLPDACARPAAAGAGPAGAGAARAGLPPAGGAATLAP